MLETVLRIAKIVFNIVCIFGSNGREGPKVVGALKFHLPTQFWYEEDDYPFQR